MISLVTKFDDFFNRVFKDSRAMSTFMKRSEN